MKQYLVLFALLAAVSPALVSPEFPAAPRDVREEDIPVYLIRIEDARAVSGMIEFNDMRRVNGPETCI